MRTSPDQALRLQGMVEVILAAEEEGFGVLRSEYSDTASTYVELQHLETRRRLHVMLYKKLPSLFPGEGDLCMQVADILTLADTENLPEKTREFLRRLAQRAA